MFSDVKISQIHHVCQIAQIHNLFKHQIHLSSKCVGLCSERHAATTGQWAVTTFGVRFPPEAGTPSEPYAAHSQDFENTHKFRNSEMFESHNNVQKPQHN